MGVFVVGFGSLHKRGYTPTNTPPSYFTPSSSPRLCLRRSIRITKQFSGISECKRHPYLDPNYPVQVNATKHALPATWRGPTAAATDESTCSLTTNFVGKASILRSPASAVELLISLCGNLRCVRRSIVRRRTKPSENRETLLLRRSDAQ